MVNHGDDDDDEDDNNDDYNVHYVCSYIIVAP